MHSKFLNIDCTTGVLFYIDAKELTAHGNNFSILQDNSCVYHTGQKIGERKVW